MAFSLGDRHSTSAQFTNVIMPYGQLDLLFSLSAEIVLPFSSTGILMPSGFTHKTSRLPLDTLGRAVALQDSNVFLDMPDHHALPRTDITYLADNLFTKFNVSVTTPEPDWFMRPRSRPGSPPTPAKQTESTAEHPPSPISNLITNSEVDDIHRLAAPMPSRVLDQLNHRIEAIGVNSHGQPAIFDPTPGGRLFSSQGRIESASTSGISRPWSRYNHTVGGASPLGVTGRTSSQHNLLPQQSVTLEDCYEEDLLENVSDISDSVCESLFD
ncbi:gtpase-activator for ras gtpase [Fusarium pseudocircinatum]|uniref:Gtpase-activator for ras gtpase n=1 Tax=Fusarium pseudocircinatum TaxID=56676 RepID=A0A8H5URS6_9HYPO|nr:gtpase-activator for ras gtpase [Fusarium pseudocircinatum]